ncbi:hypothetical protein LCGC14_2086760 [marine sediment metagenome]|uniref:Uncharacterized protein n=1 Tax=marine sediment metagenome TaxID=412755 RepID=A0A0F9EE83_9ZZZZ
MSKFADMGIVEWEGVILGARSVYPTREEFAGAVEHDDGDERSYDEVWAAFVWACICRHIDFGGTHYHFADADRVDPRQRGVVKAWAIGVFGNQGY